MKDVRPGLNSIYDCAFEPANGVAKPMASLETLIVNLVCRIGHGSYDSACRTRDYKATLKRPLHTLYHKDHRTIVPMIEAAINAKACPRATRISIFGVNEDLYPRYDARNQLKHMSLEEHNLLTNTVIKMPYIALRWWPDNDFLRYVDSGGESEGALGGWTDLSMLAESHAWG